MDATKPSWNPEWEKDIVYLHVLPRDRVMHIPNLSPFAMKLETWLILNNIKYEVIDYNGSSSKGQSPFLMFNEKEIPDSNFSIEYLSEYFHKDPYPGLSKSEKAVARAFLKMIEENTVWSIFWYRYVDHVEDEFVNHIRLNEMMKTVFPKSIKEGMTQKAHHHGIGRHSSEEIYKIGCDDIRAISDFLGDKTFLMGDTPTLVDCAIFGALVQIVYFPMNFPMKAVIEKECLNIVQLLERIKSLYWPHWDNESI